MTRSNQLNTSPDYRHHKKVLTHWQYLAVVMAFFFYAFQGTSLLAQSDLISVRGSVVDNGEPVVGATFMVKGLFHRYRHRHRRKLFTHVSPTGTWLFLHRV